MTNASVKEFKNILPLCCKVVLSFLLYIYVKNMVGKCLLLQYFAQHRTTFHVLTPFASKGVFQHQSRKCKLNSQVDTLTTGCKKIVH